MTRRLLSAAAVLVLLLNVSGTAALAHLHAHDGSARHDASRHDDGHCAVCQAVAAARSAAPPPVAPALVTARPAPRGTAHAAAPALYRRDLPTCLTARGPPAAA